MSWMEAELAEFGRRIGLPTLAFSSNGTCQLRLESGDHLAVDVVDERVVIYRRHPLPWPPPDMLERALRLCNTRSGGQPVQVGLRGQGGETELVIALQLHARAFTAQGLEQCWDRLRRWLDQLGSA